MLDFAWFRLVVRAIGILLIGLGAPSVVNSVIGYVNFLVYLRATNPALPNLMYLTQTIGSATQFGMGVYLLFGANRLVGYCVRSVAAEYAACADDDAIGSTPKCLSCGYELTNTTGACPECGVPIRASPRPTGSA